MRRNFFENWQPGGDGGSPPDSSGGGESGGGSSSSSSVTYSANHSITAAVRRQVP